MERGSHGVISGADASGGGDNKDKGKDRDSSRRVNESEGEEYSEFEDDTLSERSSVHVYTVNQKTASYSDESAMDVELPDSESEGAISAPLTVTSPRGAKNSKSPIVYSDDFSYLNSLSRQERRRIEGEIIKGRKLGGCIILL